LICSRQYLRVEVMNKRDLFTLVLGSTGNTGSRVVADLINRGLKIRTAALRC
jgi:hypothetical protein